MSSVLEQPAPVPATFRRRALQALQVVVTLALIGWLVRQVDWGTVGPLLRNVRWPMVAGALASLLLSHLINVVRWRYLLDRRELGFGRLLRWYAIGLFSTNILPTGIGGDAVRAGLSGRAVPLGRALFAVVLDRGMGLVALSALIGLGLIGGLPFDLGLPARLSAPGAIAAGGVLTLGVIGVALLGWSRRAAVRRQAARWDLPPWGLAEWLRRLVTAYALSVAAQLAIVVANAAVLLALGIAAPWPVSIWLVVFSSLSLLLPIAINGIGVVEGVYVVVLGAYGVPAALGLSAALLIRLIALAISLLGGAAMLGRSSISDEARK